MMPARPSPPPRGDKTLLKEPPMPARPAARPRPQTLSPRAGRIRIPALILALILALSTPWPCPAQPPAEQQPTPAPQAGSATPQPDPQATPATPDTPPQPGTSPAEPPAQAARLSLLGREATLAERDPTPSARRFQENWRAMLSRHHPDAVFGATTCPLPGPILNQWKNITARMPAMPPEEKLRTINGFFNSWSGESDLKSYGQEEYWAAPEEFLAKGGGDCEDYAIIKYLALRHFGWPAEDLWVVFVRDRINKGDHAVLAARANNRVFILDNLSRPAYLLIPEKQYAGQVTPMFALSERGVWIFPAEESSRKEESKAGAPNKKDNGKKTPKQ